MGHLCRNPLCRDYLYRDPLCRDPLCRDPLCRDPLCRDSLCRDPPLGKSEIDRDFCPTEKLAAVEYAAMMTGGRIVTGCSACS